MAVLWLEVKTGCRTQISADKALLVAGKRLSMHPEGYVWIWVRKNKKMMLSHLVDGRPPKGFVKDHINNDKLDNRNENLRNATWSENCQNKSKKKGATSRFTGVHSVARGKKWCAGICINHRTFTWRFADELEAAKQYDRAAFFYYKNPKNNGLLTAAEREHAMLNAPICKGRQLPRFVYQRDAKYEVILTNLGGERQGFGIFANLEEAKTKVSEVLEEQAQAKRARHQARDITRNAEGQAVIYTNSRKPNPVPVIVDDALWHEISFFNWSWSRPGYPYRRGEKKNIRLHQFVFHLLHPNETVPEDCVVDHANGRLDDVRGENLRILTRAENSHNCKKRKDTATSFTGVHPSGNGYAAKIHVNGVMLHIAQRNTREEAYECYLAAAKIYFPGCYKSLPEKGAS